MHYQHPSALGHPHQAAPGAEFQSGRQNPPYNFQEYQYGYGETYTPAEGDPATANWSRGWFTFSDSRYLKGFLVGAGAAVILTNPVVQKTLLKGVVKLWSGVECGIEEVKEQIKDFKAESDIKQESGS